MRPIRHTLLIVLLPLVSLAAGGESPPTIEARSAVVLWESPPSAPLDLSRAVFLVPQGTRCTPQPSDAKPPMVRWSCEVQHQQVTGFARAAAFEAKPKNIEQVPKILLKYLERYSGAAVQCGWDSAQPSPCDKARAIRMNLHWATRSLVLRPPSSPLWTHPCPQDDWAPCLRQRFSEGTAASTLEEDEFLVAQAKGPDLVRFTVGTMDRAAHTISGIEQLDLRDPLFASLVAGTSLSWTELGPVDRASPAAKFIADVPASRTFVFPRRFSVAPLVVCPDKIVRLENLTPARSSLTERVSWSNSPDFMYATYEYALPCQASLVLGGSIPGLKPGPKAPSPYEARLSLDWSGKKVKLGPLTISGDPRGSGAFYDCRLEFQGMKPASSHDWCSFLYGGDLNGDGKLDFVIDTREETCGGPALWLSTPNGWEVVVRNTGYC